MFSHAMESEGGGFRNMRRQRREGSVDSGGEGWKGSVGIFGPVRSKEMVVDQVDEDWSKAAVRRRDSADALADSRMAVREGVDAMMAGDAALNFGREMAEFVGAQEIRKNVAEPEFGRGFGQINVSKPVQFAMGR